MQEQNLKKVEGRKGLPQETKSDAVFWKHPRRQESLVQNGYDCQGGREGKHERLPDWKGQTCGMRK